MLSATPSAVRMIPFSVAAAVPAAFLKASQAARLPLQLRSIDHSDFSLVSPAVGSFGKASANRILADVLPFLRITFVAAQNVIKESRLPKSQRFYRDRHGTL